MKVNNLFAGLMILAMLAGCYPQEDYISTGDLDTVVTYKPTGSDPTQSTTYAISPVLYDDEYDGYDGWYNNALIAQIRSNLNALGYTEEADPDNNTPDLVIIPEIVFTDNYLVGGGGCYYSCWGWNCDFWYGCYPPYYPPSYVVSYSTGSILIHMVDSDVQANNENKNVLWNVAIDGFLRKSLNSSVLNALVDQAFDQSTDYLSKN